MRTCSPVRYRTITMSFPRWSYLLKAVVLLLIMVNSSAYDFNPTTKPHLKASFSNTIKPTINPARYWPVKIVPMPMTKLETIFTAIHSKIIVPFTPFNIIIFHHSHKKDVKETPVTEPLLFKATVELRRITYNESEEVVIQPGNYRILSFTPTNLLPSDAVIIRFYARHGSDGEPHRAYDFLRVQPSASVNGWLKKILIDIDKPVYKPGETVQIRTILLDPNNRPPDVTTISLSLKIENPNGILIKSWTNLSNDTSDSLRDFGLFKSQLLLSSDTTVGTWRIKATAVAKNDNFTATHSRTVQFKVDNYIPPKFEVTLYPPSYIFLTDEIVTVSVQAKYSNGGNFQGNCTLIAKVKPASECIWIRETSLNFAIMGYNATLQHFSIQDLIKSGYTPKDGDSLQIEATVRENGTGKNITVIKSTSFVKIAHKIRLIEETIPAKRGLYYNITLQVVTLDNIPITDETPDIVQIATNLLHTKGSKFTVPVGENGIIHLTFGVPPFDTSSDWIFSNYLCGTFYIKITYRNYTYGHTPTNTNDSHKHIQLLPASRFVSPNSNTTIKVVANSRNLTSLKYVLLNESNVLTGGSVSFPATDEYNLIIPVPNYKGSHLTVVVFTYLVRNHLQTIPSSLVLTTVTEAQPNPNNFLSIQSMELNTTASKNVVLSLSSKKGSLVSVRALDRSLLSLPYAQRDFSWEILYWDRTFNYQKNIFEYPTGQTPYNIITSVHMDDESPLTCKNSQYLGPEFQYIKTYTVSCGLMFGVPWYSRTPLSEQVYQWKEGKVDRKIQKVFEPNFFPETWLWDNFLLANDSSVINVSIPSPDPSKSWIITGYSLNPTQNIKLIESPSKFSTSTPFFISLSLPYSVVKGEMLTVVVLVHNNRADETNLNIFLDGTEGDFELKDTSSNMSGVLTKCQGYSVCLASFEIELTQSGEIHLQATAKMFKGPNMFEDSVTEQLLVIQPGRKITRSTSILWVPNSAVSYDTGCESTLQPEHLQGTEKITFSISSENWRPSINDLEYLIQSPVKNAEQNMAIFAVATEVLKYMQAMEEVNPEYRSNIIAILEKRYQTQLRYRHADGSFSLYGHSGDKGSTWLTAFVIRSINAAKEFITIDNSVIEQGLTFILNQTDQTSGNFVENSRLQNSTAGRNEKFESKTTLTAYCLVSLIESGLDVQTDNHSVITKAIKFLLNEVSDDDSFALALTTYALHLEGARNYNATTESAPKFFSKLKRRVVIESNNGTSYWRTSNSEESTPTDKVKSAWIETTGYALMVYTINKEIDAALPIAKWLLSMRNSRGGFLSNQDTVIGLAALAKYVESQNKADNKYLLQESPLRTVVASGSGSFAGQLVCSYYVKDFDEEGAFKININVVVNAPIFLKLSVCISSVSEEASDLIAVEVNLPSGYVVDNDELTKLANVSGYKHYSVEGKNTKLIVSFSLEKVKPPDNETCFQVYAYEAYQVRKRLPSFVNVYGYPHSAMAARKSYSF